MHDLGIAALWVVGIIVVLLVLKLFVWIFRVFYGAGQEWGAAIKQASQPVPSPLEIEAALQNEWGRQPNVQEVQAVHQMLHSEHNQALIKSGIGFGALYLLGRS